MTTGTDASPITSPLEQLDQRLRNAIARLLEIAPEEADPLLRPSQRPEFGDFQANAAMALAKARGLAPRDLAAQIIAAVDLSDLTEPPDVAGPASSTSASSPTLSRPRSRRWMTNGSASSAIRARTTW